jgi:hypothetical protein
MNARSRWAGGLFVVVALVVWALAPTAQGKGAPHASAPHHSGGGGHPQHFSAPKPQVYHVPKMPVQHSSQQMPHVNMNAVTHGNASAHLKANATPHVSSAMRGVPRSKVVRNNATRNTAKNNAHRTLAMATGAAPSAVTGIGTGTISRATTRPASTYAPYGYRGGYRRNRGYGYGSRYYGRRSYGYGNRNYQSQQFNRMLAQQLRSAHRSLAQLDRDYQGHRSRAMQHISMAVRQLTGRTNYYRGANVFGNAGMVNNGLRNQGGVNGNLGGMRMSQAQSDSRVRRAQRMLQNVNMQLTARGYSTRHARSRAYVQRGMQELNTALTIR